MKKYYFLFILCTQFVSAQTIEKTRKIVPLMSQQTFYLNGGMRSAFGGKSRTYYKIDLPPNTISWYYVLTTAEGQQPSNKALNLIPQLARAFDSTGLTSVVLTSIMTPTGVAACDTYLMNRANADAFLEKADLVGGNFYSTISGSRANFRNGIVEIKDAVRGTYYLGFKNPSPNTGVAITFEAAAIVEETTVNNNEWATDTKERFHKHFYKQFAIQLLGDEVADKMSDCMMESIMKSKTPAQYDLMSSDELNTFLEEIKAICFKSIQGINSAESEKAVSYGNLGWRSYESGDIDKCIEYSRKALTFDNTLGYVKSNLGLCYLIKGDEATASDYYIESIADIKRLKLTTQIKEYLQASIDDINNALSKNPLIKGAVAIKSMFQDELNNY